MTLKPFINQRGTAFFGDAEDESSDTSNKTACIWVRYKKKKVSKYQVPRTQMSQVYREGITAPGRRSAGDGPCARSARRVELSAAAPPVPRRQMGLKHPVSLGLGLETSRSRRRAAN